jgi:hypothetical protein
MDRISDERMILDLFEDARQRILRIYYWNGTAAFAACDQWPA